MMRIDRMHHHHEDTVILLNGEVVDFTIKVVVQGQTCVLAAGRALHGAVRHLDIFGLPIEWLRSQLYPKIILCFPKRVTVN
jgi:hypothetical protein